MMQSLYMQKIPSKKEPAFDVQGMDHTVRPQDDFFKYANGGWIKKTKIPADESRWGTFNILRYNTEHQLRALVKGLQGKRFPTGSNEQMVADAYRAALDMPARNKLGLKPILPLLKRVRSIESLEEMLAVVTGFHARGIPALWGAFVDMDSMDSKRYRFTLWQGGLSLPERDYYLLEKPEQKRIRDAFVPHMARILKLAKYSPKEIKHAQEVIIRIETKLAEASMRREDMRQPERIYNKRTIAALSKESPTVPWQLYFETLDANVREVVVGQPEFFKALSVLLKSIPLEDWKLYMEWHLINGSASALSEQFIKANFEFYGKVMTGQKKMRAPWRRALGSTTSLVGESLGKLYIKKHFPETSKKVMDALVSDLFEVFAERIKGLEWMSPATKQKALKKLRAMTRKIGYPTKWKGYPGLVIKHNDYFGNLMRSGEFEQKRAMRKLRGPVDRSEWHMYPQTVNAYFSPNLNEIVFPAGILQTPFFDPKADMALNYGCIGAVIGHEITHGFDDEGSKFDHKGTLHNWWSPNDRKRFERRAEVLVKQTNEQEVAPGVHINGKLTLGENIADLGGLIIAYEAYQKYLDKHGRETIDGYTPEERFFLGFALFERETSRPEYKKLAALTDPHAEGFWRINGPCSNFDGFYKTYKLKKGDKMYREPKAQTKIW